MTRPFEVIDCEQRTPEWFAARLGRVTGSTADAVLAKGKGSAESVQRRNLRVKLALERFTKQPLSDDVFVTQAMQRGIEREAAALSAYEVKQGELITRVGFVSRLDYMAGVSPDGVVGEFDGLVEVKCPIPATHWETLRNQSRGFDALPSDYQRQILHGQLVTGCQWTDFVSYCPEFGSSLELVVIRIVRDDNAVMAYAQALAQFLAEVDRETAELALLAQAVCA